MYPLTPKHSGGHLGPIVPNIACQNKKNGCMKQLQTTFPIVKSNSYVQNVRTERRLTV